MSRDRGIDGSHLKSLYDQGVNLMRFLGGEAETNELSNILSAYDMQSGSYVARMDDAGYRAAQEAFNEEVAAHLGELEFESLLDAGVGEGTSLAGILRALPQAPSHVEAFDISWSRIDVARGWFARFGLQPSLCTGELTRMPFADGSFDVVMTNQSIEPNRGREREILTEIHRVAARYAVLVEPAYELADDEQRARMDHHRYVTDLPGHAEAVGFRVRRLERLARPLSPANPTAVLLLEKEGETAPGRPRRACPRSGDALIPMRGHLAARRAGFVYPVLDGIPCLMAQDAIFASRFGAEAQEVRSEAAGS